MDRLSDRTEKKERMCMQMCSEFGLLLNFHFAFLQDQVLANDPLPDILNVLDNGLEV